MLYYTLPQGVEFAAMLLTGAIMAALSLPFSVVRRLMRAGRILSAACDALMGAVWAGCACAALVYACRGRARAYHFFAMASGASLFMAAISPPLRVCARALTRRTAALARALGASRAVRALLK